MYYFTKYWQSSEILKIDSDALPNEDGIVFVRGCISENRCSYTMRLGEDCFHTIEEARVNVVAQLAKAIKAAEKKLAKLKSINPATMKVT